MDSKITTELQSYIKIKFQSIGELCNLCYSDKQEYLINKETVEPCDFTVTTV